MTQSQPLLYCNNTLDDEDIDMESSEMIMPRPLLAMPSVARVDPALVGDRRVLLNMLRAEQERLVGDYCRSRPTELPSGGGFVTTQAEIRPHMRKIVLDWLLEVCQDQQCQPQVFHLAVNYLDRYLTRYQLPKRHLQAVGAACLLLATKFADFTPVSSDNLAAYTDHSVSVAELYEWEVKILTALRWELSAVTVQSFLDYFLASASIRSNHVANNSSSRQSAINHEFRLRAEAVAESAATEYRFIRLKPSQIAAACLAMVCHGRGMDNEPKDLLNNNNAGQPTDTKLMAQTPNSRLMDDLFAVAVECPTAEDLFNMAVQSGPHDANGRAGPSSHALACSVMPCLQPCSPACISAVGA